jgi:glycosyltransferase involved in cell wall biosynthesis
VRLRQAIEALLESRLSFTSAELIDFATQRSAGAAECAPAPCRRASAPPRISIVMPSFNHGHFIESSLLSVLNQGYPNLELIVMDGGSSDSTRQILTRYDREIAHWRSEPDGGQSDALNKGFREASGEIFGWLNSDDLYCPGAFEFAADVLHNHPEIQVVYGDWYTIGLDHRISTRFFGLPYSRSQTITEGVFCNAQAMFWRKDLHRRFGEFDPRLHYTMDYDLILRFTQLAGRAGFFRTHRPLGCFRVYPGQKTETVGGPVAVEHWLIAEKLGTTWRYGMGGRAVRMFYRAKRVRDYFVRGGLEYVLWKLGMAPNPLEGM